MRSKSLFHVVLGLATLLPAAMACGSGTISSDGSTGSNWENHPGDFATPTQDNQESAPYPGVGGKPAPTGGGGACPCGNTYVCTFTSDGKSESTTIRFNASTSGQCSLSGKDVDDDTALACNGTLLDKGKTAGTWTGDANQFSISAGSSDGSITCVKTTTAVAEPTSTPDPYDPPPVPPATPSRPADAG